MASEFFVANNVTFGYYCVVLHSASFIWYFVFSRKKRSIDQKWLLLPLFSLLFSPHGILSIISLVFRINKYMFSLIKRSGKKRSTFFSLYVWCACLCCRLLYSIWAELKCVSVINYIERRNDLWIITWNIFYIERKRDKWEYMSNRTRERTESDSERAL